MSKRGLLTIIASMLAASAFCAILILPGPPACRTLSVTSAPDDSTESTPRKDPADLLPVQRGNRHGFIDRTGRMVIEPQFDYAGSFNYGLAEVMVGKWRGFVDRTGKYVIPPQLYEAKGDFHDGLAAIKSVTLRFLGFEIVRLRMGYIDLQGNVAIKPQFDVAMEFSEGRAAVQCNYRWAFIDRRGNLVTEFKYDQVQPFSDGLAVVSEHGAAEYIDRNGKTVIQGRLGWAGVNEFSEGLIAAYSYSPDGSRFGFVDKTGRRVIAARFEECGNFSEGLAGVTLDEKKWGFIDKQGKMVIKPAFDEVQEFSEGMVPVMVKKSWGYADRTGTLIIPAKFPAAKPFSNGIAEVQTGMGKDRQPLRGYINKNGDLIWQDDH